MNDIIIGSNSNGNELDIPATGRRIKELMDAKGITIRETCEKLNVSFQAVYKWQKGESLPTINNLFLLSRLLDVNLEDMLVPKQN